jgi:hypothetical protein
MLVEDGRRVFSTKGGVWARGEAMCRLRKGEALPFKTSGWKPIASSYLVRFDDDGSLAWVRKTDLRLPEGTEYKGPAGHPN